MKVPHAIVISATLLSIVRADSGKDAKPKFKPIYDWKCDTVHNDKPSNKSSEKSLMTSEPEKTPKESDPPKLESSEVAAVGATSSENDDAKDNPNEPSSDDIKSNEGKDMDNNEDKDKNKDSSKDTSEDYSGTSYVPQLKGTESEDEQPSSYQAPPKDENPISGVIGISAYHSVALVLFILFS